MKENQDKSFNHRFVLIFIFHFQQIDNLLEFMQIYRRYIS